MLRMISLFVTTCIALVAVSCQPTLQSTRASSLEASIDALLAPLVSKPFTAVAVFQLVQDGRVKLDEPVRSYCPELSALNGAPTVRDFLMHRSGMRHTTDAEDTTIKGPVPRFGASLSRVVREPLQFIPGTKTLYTSWGYVALGCVIETSSGKLYADFMRERVFAPAGLKATTFDQPAYTSSVFSPGFRRALVFGLRPSAVVDTRFKTPASGLISTVDDLAKKYGLALLANRERFVPELQPIVTQVRQLVLEGKER